MFSNKQDFIEKYKACFAPDRGRDFEGSSARERYWTLAKMLAAEARTQKISALKKRAPQKKVYYFSMEFLMGKLLENYLINFGVREIVAEGLAEMGESLENLCKEEQDPGLGNGGLGRLAACFIDSMASLGISGHGNGVRYRYGLFRQEIENGCQVEYPDNWLAEGYPWETRKPEDAVLIRFGGEVKRHERDNQFWFTWEGGELVRAVPYDVPIVGYGGETVNNLRLWSAEPYEENFDMDAFNRGDYSKANQFRADAEAITQILYPNDNGDAGKILRIKQEYLFVSAGLSSILNAFKREVGTDFSKFPDYVSIHTNDTHPALCAPELMRLLVDDEGLDWDAAWDIAVHSISYTNHTVLPEALEKWPIDMMRTLLPRVYMFIEEIDRRYRESFPQVDNWQGLLRQTAILWDGQVRMANLSVIAGHSVNGVAKIHTEILKHDVLKEFYALTPEKFNNKTNGVTHRRFLVQANPALSGVISEAIGTNWMQDAAELERLIDLKSDAAFVEKVAAAKRANKERLAAYVRNTCGISLNPDAIFDVQVKRFHAYKRQLLNIFKIMDLYEKLCSGEITEMQPAVFLFAGKAAQGYAFAKDVIRLVNSVADVMNHDPRTRGLIQVAFIPNFAVSNAQLIYPAADISEQISTAGMEASGTGNMKFMMNGAITLGTYDGANVEITEQVGMENAEIFGLRVEDIDALHASGTYLSWEEYNGNPAIKTVVNRLVDGTYEKLSGGFHGIYDALLRNNDTFFVLKDFPMYMQAWHNLERRYQDRTQWHRVALHNIAKAGPFSSDNTIKQYANEIWKLG